MLAMGGAGWCQPKGDQNGVDHGERRMVPARKVQDGASMKGTGWCWPWGEQNDAGHGGSRLVPARKVQDGAQQIQNLRELSSPAQCLQEGNSSPERSNTSNASLPSASVS